MRQIDNMTPQELDTLTLKGMTAPRTAGEAQHSQIDYWHNTAKQAQAHADKLAEALRDCETTPGALAERSHEYALRRLASITATAREALSAYEAAQ